MRVQELFDLKGQVAIVTGASIGLGHQMAEALAEAGADLVICARKVARCEKAAEDLRALGVKALPLGCDVTVPADVYGVVARTLEEFGRIDILVNNAGISWGTPAVDMSLENWNKVMATNVTGTFLFSQAVGRVMIRQQRGKIINIGSVAGLGGAPPEIVDAVGYSASKGAVISLSRDLACKWARHGININVLAPGWFPTHMSGWVLEHLGDRILPQIPLGRFGRDYDLKGAIVFLASRASDYMTGQVLVVDGGIMAW